MTYDAVIVGSGPGGSTVADVLAGAGWSVLVVEKGRNHLLDPADLTRPSSDYSNDEIKFLCRHFLGPDPLIEPIKRWQALRESELRSVTPFSPNRLLSYGSSPRAVQWRTRVSVSGSRVSRRQERPPSRVR